MKFIKEINNFIIEIFEDDTFTENSSDNKIQYETIYKTDDIGYVISKHAIVVKNEDEEIVHSLILLGARGKAIIQEDTFLLDGYNLIKCEGNQLFSIRIPDLRINWKVQADDGMAFRVILFNEDYIVHGELSISRINKAGKIIWQHYASDIFVTDDGTDSFQIINGKIYVKTWDRKRFEIEYDGRIRLTTSST